jgi:integrase-like protein
MARPSTGQVKWLYDHKAHVWCWHARFTVQGKRTRFEPIDSGAIPKDAIDQAKAIAAQHARVFHDRGAVPEGIETVKEYATRWLTSREGRVASIADERARMTKHVEPIIGLHDVKTIDRDGIERLRDDLDRKIVKGDLAWKTAASCWTLVTSMFDDCMNAKARDLRVRQDNPTRDVRAPERGASKAKQFLFPSEFLAFVTCERVPLEWRRAVAIAVYTFTRDGESKVLRWDEGDVDLEHGVLHITRSLSRRTGDDKGTKTGESRRFAIEANLLPLLRAMYAEHKGKGTIVRMRELHAARGLRRWLKVAGVDRPELHKGTPTRKPMTWHDLRATGITWLAIRGDDPLKIMSRAGHASFSTTQIYVREAENLREGFGDVFPALPPGLLGKGAHAPATAPQPTAAVPAPAPVPTPAGVSDRVSDSDAAPSRSSRKKPRNGAGHGSRTRDLRLGKPTLYQLS